MKPLLILTKNLMAERVLQEKLQYLTYEVLCSTNIFESLKLKKTVDLSMFQAIIFSDTICDKEITQIMSTIRLTDLVDLNVFRKQAGEPTSEQKELWEKLDIVDYLSDEETTERLREKLSTKLIVRNNEMAEHVQTDYSILDSWLQNSKEFTVYFSHKEKLIFQHILEARGKIVSRKELCHVLWGAEPCNSYLSQLSVCITKINKKMMEAGFQKYFVETVWGRGYRLILKQ